MAHETFEHDAWRYNADERLMMKAIGVPVQPYPEGIVATSVEEERKRWHRSFMQVKHPDGRITDGNGNPWHSNIPY